MVEWHAILNERGWLANHWPTNTAARLERGREVHLRTRMRLAGAPRIVPFGVNMLGPVLIKYGNEAQKQYWLPRILSGEDWWCQGYSEPGAGSDLASVKTTAVRDGDTTSSTARRPGPRWATTPT
jgi:alkylation response protein AidB-like acyl-CoA dehydrogenase